MLENNPHSEESFDSFYRQKAQEYRVEPSANAFSAIMANSTIPQNPSPNPASTPSAGGGSTISSLVTKGLAGLGILVVGFGIGWAVRGEKVIEVPVERVVIENSTINEPRVTMPKKEKETISPTVVEVSSVTSPTTTSNNTKSNKTVSTTVSPPSVPNKSVIGHNQDNGLIPSTVNTQVDKDSITTNIPKTSQLVEPKEVKKLTNNNASTLSPKQELERLMREQQGKSRREVFIDPKK
ncbi:MAG: hypothetical protein GY827_05735 [Cytophagales bacterium]|nr:hypothetical protein [Cytophagales bacterium]